MTHKTSLFQRCLLYGLLALSPLYAQSPFKQVILNYDEDTTPSYDGQMAFAGGILYSLGDAFAALTDDGLVFGLEGMGISSVASNGSLWLAYSPEFGVFSSADGLAWSPVAINHDLRILSGLHSRSDRFWGSDGQSLFSSLDGVTWEKHTPDGFTFGPGSELIVGENHIVLKNYDRLSVWDGTSFQLVQRYIEEVRYLDGFFYILTRARLYRAVDGINWEAIGPNLDNARDMAMGNGVVLVSDGAILHYSNNMTDWQTIDSVEFDDEMAELLHFNGSEFVTHDKSQVFASQDGLSWTANTGINDTPRSLNLLTAGHGRSYFAYRYELDTRIQAYTSSEASVAILPLFTNRVLSVASNQDIVIGFDAEGDLFRRDATGQWRVHLVEGNTGLAQVIHDGSRFLSFWDNQLRSSVDGISWTAMETDVTGSVFYAAGRYFFRNRSSLDLNTWQDMNITLDQVAGNDLGFVASRSDGLYFSEDGLTWTLGFAFPSNGFDFPKFYTDKVAAGPTSFVAVGFDGSIVSSTDGQTWSVRRSPAIRTLNRVIWSGDQFVAVGEQGQVLTSADGTRWQAQELLSAIDLESVTATSQGLVLAGDAVVAQTAPLNNQTDTFKTDAVIPWVVNNGTWQSQISLSGVNAAMEVRLRAVTDSGHVEEVAFDLKAQESLVRNAGDLFPGLTRYALHIDASGRHIQTSYLTFYQGDGVPSPSQTIAQYTNQMSDQLLYGYFPGQGGALVLVTPDKTDGETVVRVSLLGQSGIESEKDLVLTGAQPTAMLLSTLFEGESLPENAALRVKAQDGSRLTGTTFVFDDIGQPSMSATFPIHSGN